VESAFRSEPSRRAIVLIRPVLSFAAALRVRAEPREIPMHMSDIPFGTTDWSAVPETVHPGETGTARWRTREFGDIRVRVVEYSPGYLADHWCSKGHILYVLEGVLHTELEDGRKVTLTPGTSYQVADGAEAHRSSTETGVRLFIID
jgi:quercetin dioxygenase-like cupin family protein